MAQVIVPLRDSVWALGDLGCALHRVLQDELLCLPGVTVTRLPRAFLVESGEIPAMILEAVENAARTLEGKTAEAFPALYADYGPAWAGTLQVVFPDCVPC